MTKSTKYSLPMGLWNIFCRHILQENTRLWHHILNIIQYTKQSESDFASCSISNLAAFRGEQNKEVQKICRSGMFSYTYVLFCFRNTQLPLWKLNYSQFHYYGIRPYPSKEFILVCSLDTSPQIKVFLTTDTAARHISFWKVKT